MRNKNAYDGKMSDRIDMKVFILFLLDEMHYPLTESVIAEIVDEAGRVLPHGEYGELVITTIGMEALPLCREHHREAHDHGDKVLMDKYHLEAVKIDKEIAKVYRLGRGKNG